MYEKALATNQRLKSRLETSKQELAMIQDQLHRAEQVQTASFIFSDEKGTDCSCQYTDMFSW